MGSTGTNVNMSLNNEEKQLLNDWTLTGYENLKKDSRIENIIAKLPKYKNKIYRGMTMYQSTIDKMSIGDKFDLRGISSWTTTQNRAADFSNLSFTHFERGNPVRVILSVKKPYQSIDISNYSKFTTEKEIITSANVNYTINNISKSKMVDYDYMGRKQSVDVYKIELK